MARLLFLAGSARKESLNKKLAKYACDIAQSKGADATFIDLKNFEMPLFCEDYESENGIPETTKALKKMFQDCDGFLMASPEYNSTFSPVLKNTIDWMSRSSVKGEQSAYQGKIAAICSTSPGAIGGLRGLTPLRTMLANIGVHVIPTQLAVGGMDAMNDQGELTKDMHINMMDAMVDQLIKTADALNA